MLRLRKILQYKLVYVVFLIISLIFSYLITNINIKSKYDLNTQVIEGIILSYTQSGDKISFIVKGKEKVKCTYYINNNNIEILNGIKVRITGNMQEPNNNTVPNTFNYKKYLKQNNINYIMNVDNINIINNENIFYRIKNKLIKHINNFKSSAYLFAFIIGDKNYFNDGVYEQYQKLGISHIFAISGMHVSLLTMIIYKLLSKTKMKDNQSYPLIIIFLLFYSFITSYQASIERSIGLYILLYINKRLNLNIETLNILLLDIAILLFINPYFLYNIGFQYSTIVSYSLIKYSRLIKGNYLLKTIKISTISILYSLPITLINNYEFNILSILNNIIFVPLISLIIYPLSLAVLIIKPLDIVYFNILKIMELISNKLFVFNIIIPKCNLIVYAIYYICVYIFFRTYRKNVLLIPIVLLTIIKLSVFVDNNFYVNYIDVGQGDSIFLKYKTNTILIDTGGKLNSTYKVSNTTIKYMKSIGVSKIDYLITTHGDNDHLGDAINVVNNFKVKNVILNCGDYNELENELIDVLNKKKIKYYSCISELKIDKYKLEFLNTVLYDNENDNSNVIYLNYDNNQFLFMGDASSTREKDILKKYNLKNIDFLKAGHHGSDTSSSENFINNIKPKYSIISVGANNRYGHPRDSVLKILNNVNSKIYRTDEDGSIEIKIDKSGYKIKTYSP